LRRRKTYALLATGGQSKAARFRPDNVFSATIIDAQSSQ
jgi:hypothetical protein